MDAGMPIGLRFSILHRSFMRQLDERLREKGLTGVQFGVLGQLRRLEKAGAEEVNQRDLEQATHVTHPTMTEIVKRLEKQGFALCRASARDRRYKCIRSTEKAEALLLEMKELDDSIFQSLCVDLSAEEVGVLLRLTDQLLKNACTAEQKGSEEA